MTSAGPCGTVARSEDRGGWALAWSLLHLLPALNAYYASYAPPERNYPPLHRQTDPYEEG